MIVIKKQYKISGISGTFNINVKIPDCATLIKKEYDPITEILSLEITYCDRDCLLNNDSITVSVFNNENCIFTQEFIVADNCDNFVFTNGGIYIPDGCDTACILKFKADTTYPLATYTWEYDTNIFTKIESADAKILALSYTDAGSLLSNINTIIKLTAVNDNKCEIKTAYTYTICNSTAEPIFLDLDCAGSTRGGNTFISDFVTPTINKCVSQDNIQFINENFITRSVTIAGILYTISANAKGDKLQLTAQEVGVVLINSRVVQIPFEYSICGNKILALSIITTIYPCVPDSFIKPFNFDFDCENCKGVATTGNVQARGIREDLAQCTPPTINLLDYIVTSNAVLWNTFRFNPTTPIQQLVSSTELQTPFASVIYSESTKKVTYFTTGGLTTTDLVFFSIDLDNGKTINGELRFNGPKCNDTTDLIATDIDVCLTPANNQHTVRVASSVNTVNITQFPANITLYQSGTSLIFNANGYIGQDEIKYIITNPAGLTSNEGTVRITSKEPIVIKESVCVNETGKAIVDLSAYNLDINTQDLYWIFGGYSNSLDIIPGTLAIPFIVNNGAIQTYSALESLSINNTCVVELDSAGIYLFKTQLQTCGSDIEVYIQVVESEVLPLNSYKNVCKTAGLVNLFNLLPTEIPTTGTWQAIGNTTINIIDNSKINTLLSQPNDYMLRYSIPNAGLYNPTACTSQMILHLTIDNIVDDILPKCITLCSLGPDPVITPNCQNISVDVDINNVAACSLELYQALEIPSTALITFKSLPLNPIILDINGENKLYRIGDVLPTNFLNWEYYKAPLGVYSLEVLYGGACQKKVVFDITLLGAGCDVEDSSFQFCNIDESLNLYEHLETTTCSISLVTQISGTDTTSFDSSTGIFNPQQPGMWVFEYSNSVDSSYDECEICANVATITILVHPLPGPGIPKPGSVCNAGCSVDVYPDLFEPNQSILGTFAYNGFRTSYLAIPAVCNVPLSTSNGPLTNADLPLVSGPITAGSILPNGTIEFAVSAAIGFYYFSNTVVDANGCECTSQTVVQVVTPLIAGSTSGASNVCDNDPQIHDLRDFISGEDSGGQWLVQSFTPNVVGESYDISLVMNGIGFWQNNDQATFNTLNQPTGLYVFRYIHTTPPSIFPFYTACVDCGVNYADVNVIINQSYTSGSGSSIATCPE